MNHMLLFPCLKTFRGSPEHAAYTIESKHLSWAFWALCDPSLLTSCFPLHALSISYLWSPRLDLL